MDSIRSEWHNNVCFFFSYQGLSWQTDIGITVNSFKCLFFSIFKNKTTCQNHLCPIASPCGADSVSCSILKTSVSRGHPCRYLSACEWDHMKRAFLLCCFGFNAVKMLTESCDVLAAAWCGEGRRACKWASQTYTLISVQEFEGTNLQARWSCSWWRLMHETNMHHVSSCVGALLMQISANDAQWALSEPLSGLSVFFLWSITHKHFMLKLAWIC